MRERETCHFPKMLLRNLEETKLNLGSAITPDLLFTHPFRAWCPLKTVCKSIMWPGLKYRLPAQDVTNRPLGEAGRLSAMSAEP